MSESRLLALDTTGETFSLALTEGGRLLAECLTGQPRSHLVQLFPHLAQMLTQVGWKASQLDGLVVTTGPGSFTGLRTGLLVAKSLAQAQNIPCSGVDTLEALAANLWQCPSAVACLDARKGEIVWAHFQVEGGLARPLAPNRLDSPEVFVKSLPAGSVLLGGGCQPCLELFNQRQDLQLAPPDLWRVRASSLARQALPRIEAGATTAWAQLRPEYVRPADVQVHKA